jgi:hypothetical protein
MASCQLPKSRLPTEPQTPRQAATAAFRICQAPNLKIISKPIGVNKLQKRFLSNRPSPDLYN